MRQVLFILHILTCVIVLTLCGCAKKVESDYFPLETGNSWVYDTRVDGVEKPFKWEVKINRVDRTGDHEAFVLETFVDDSKESLIKEYYGRTKEGYVVYKRVYPREEVVNDPPVLMVKTPLQPGLQWSWKGRILDAPAESAFKTEKKETIRAMNRDFDCIKVEITSTLPTGEKLHSVRWFADHVGLVKEDSTVTKGSKSKSMHGLLREFTLGEKSKGTQQ
ncbi:MAG: hypothetical protein AB9903_00420 [Vulcanimicrobiota bacterium]